MKYIKKHYYKSGNLKSTDRKISNTILEKVVYYNSFRRKIKKTVECFGNY